MDARSPRILSEIKTMDPDLFALQVFINNYSNTGQIQKYFCTISILRNSIRFKYISYFH